MGKADPLFSAYKNCGLCISVFMGRNHLKIRNYIKGPKLHDVFACLFVSAVIKSNPGNTDSLGLLFESWKSYLAFFSGGREDGRH